MIRAFHTMGNPGRGAHEATLQAGRCVYQVREQLAELFHAEKGERIAFTSNATEALNTAILGLFHKGDHVITTVCEHNSVLRSLYRLQEEGVEVSFLSADENSVLEYEKLPDLVKENTKGIIVTHASNLTGNITDLEKIREVAERRNLLLVVDGRRRREFCRWMCRNRESMSFALPDTKGYWVHREPVEFMCCPGVAIRR